MKILFLDIDGVLNAHEPYDSVIGGNRIYHDKAMRLNRVLLTTDAKLVLSSAWRYQIINGWSDLNGFAWLLRSHGIIGDRLISHTAADTMHDGTWDGVAGTWPIYNERGKQITDWLECHPESRDCRYVVLDDLDLGISEAGHPFVQTDGKIGLTDQDTERLIGLLV